MHILNDKIIFGTGCLGLCKLELYIDKFIQGSLAHHSCYLCAIKALLKMCLGSWLGGVFFVFFFLTCSSLTVVNPFIL